MQKIIKPFFCQHLFLYILVAIYIATLFTQVSFAQDSNNDCKVDPPQLHNIYKYIDKDSGYLESIETIHENICTRVRDGKMPLEAANFIQHAFIVRLGTCRGYEVNQQVPNELFGELPEPIYRIFEIYCKDKYPYKGDDWELKVIESALWLGDY